MSRPRSSLQPRPAQAAKANPAEPDSTKQFTNWAGAIADNSALTYTAVSASWLQPTHVDGAGCVGSAETNWVGLGGANGTPGLLQAGFSGFADPSLDFVPFDGHAWYQVLPEMSAQTILDLTANPGEQVSVSVFGSGVIISPGSENIFLFDLTLGTSEEMSVSDPSALYENSAEVIAERPTVTATNLLTELSDMGFIFFQGPEYQTTASGWTAFLPDVDDGINMVNSDPAGEIEDFSGYTLVGDSPPTTSFDNEWLGCGTPEPHT